MLLLSAQRNSRFGYSARLLRGLELGEDAARLKLTGPRPDHHHEQAKACRPYQHCFRKLMAFEWTRPRQRRHAGHGFRSRVPAPVFA